MSQSDEQTTPLEVYPQTIAPFEVRGVRNRLGKDSVENAEIINALWLEFFESDLLSRHPDGQDDNRFYAVYTDYAAEEKIPQTITIGFKNTGAAGTGDEDISALISGATYAIFSARGPQPKALAQTWDYIAKSNLKRTYVTDFEVYGPRYFIDGMNEILVCVGIEA